jgi:mevalonate kinase
LKTSEKKYYGKIMLFGEYSVIVGSKALVVPFTRFSAGWDNSIGNDVSETIQQSRRDLKSWLHHVSTNPETSEILDTELLRKDLENGLFFDSNIPQGYGAGSSGALVAAAYERYSTEINTDNLPLVQRRLALLESYFHGNSSGIDPLACLLGKPILIDENKQIHFVDLKLRQTGVSIFLIDSKTTSKTGPLVEYFHQEMHTYSFFKKVDQIYIPAVNQAIEGIVKNETDQLHSAIKQISDFQLNHLKPMIPSHLKDKWRSGLETDDFTMKLCGSGGGGYMLVFAKNPSKMSQYFEEELVIKLT